MAVFTIFCHGTGQHRAVGDGTELIHALSAKAAGTEYDDFLILDGPGKGAGGDSANPMAGTFDPFDRTKGVKGSAPKWSRTSSGIIDMGTWRRGKAASWSPSTLGTSVNAIGSVYSGGKAGVAAGLLGTLLSPLAVPLTATALKTSSTLRGNVYGEGMDDNIRHAMAALGNKWNDFGGHTVNLIGWSRGAVTCIRMANWMQEFYGTGLNVNIFAVDPVAGNDLGLEVADTYTIPAIVKNFVALIVLDDKRGGFAPQDINRLKVQDKSGTHFALLPLPGAHDTLVMMGKSSELAEVAEIARYLGYKFLANMGSRFKDVEVTYSAVQLADKYAAIKTKAAGYAAQGKKNVVKAAMGGIVTRQIVSDLPRYMSHNPSYFVNEHHVECFKLAFPRVYQLFFTASTGLTGPQARATHTSVAASSDLGRHLQALYQQSPASCELLMTLGVLDRRTAGVMGTGPAFWTVKPAGLYTGDNGAMISGRGVLRAMVG